VNKNYFIALTFVFVLVAGVNSIKPALFNDERIYLISAAYIEQGIITNPEHPQLLKWVYAAILPAEIKQEIRQLFQPTFEVVYNTNQWCDAYSSLPQDKRLYRIGQYTRLVTGFILLLICVAYFRLTWKTVIAINIMLLTNTTFAVVLDGWLILASMIAIDLALTKKHQFAQIALGLIAIPLMKANGIWSSLILLYVDRRYLWQKIVLLIAIMLFLYTPDGISITSGLYMKQMARGALHYIHFVPVYAMAIMYVNHKQGLENG
jgi:hypothetical protein